MEAEQHFENATAINSNLATLWTYRGMACHNCGKTNKALTYFEKARMIDPLNPLNKYQAANVLFTLERYQESLLVLEELSHIVPKEAPDFVMIGKI